MPRSARLAPLLALPLLAPAPATTLDVESARRGPDARPPCVQGGHPSHLNPEEAVQFFEDVRGRLPVPLHWGTFAMDREPFREPPDRLLREALRRGIEQMTIQSPGQTIPWWSVRVRGYGAIRPLAGRPRVRYPPPVLRKGTLMGVREADP